MVLSPPGNRSEVDRSSFGSGPRTGKTVGAASHKIPRVNPRTRKPSPPKSGTAGRPDALLQAKFQQAFALHQAGQLDQARVLYEQILQQQPRHFDALHLLGVISLQAQDAPRSADLIGKAVEVNPNDPVAHNHLGIARKKLEQWQAAIASYDRAIALKSDYAEAHYNRGIALAETKQYQAAIASYDRAVACKPDYALAHNNRGNALAEIRQYEAAVASYDRATQANPQYAEAHNNCGIALAKLRQYDRAIASYEKAIALKADFAEAFRNRAVALAESGQHAAAVRSIDAALALNPRYADAHASRGIVLSEMGQHKAAIRSFDLAMSLAPDTGFLEGMRDYAQLAICDWSDLQARVTRLEGRIARGEKCSPPFNVMTLTGSAAAQKRAAEIWVAENFSQHIAPALKTHPRAEKLRIGYFSADFREHAVAYLTAEMFETHDRSRFELYAFSYTRETADATRARLVKAFDKFVDVSSMSDEQVASLSRQLKIDIAVDLGGFTQGARPAVFAMRAAPLQVSYLGYLGTMGAPFMDYLVADRTIIPNEAQELYSEKIAYLPSYQCNDSHRTIADKVFSRAELGLPLTGFVYCCFNNTYKVTPATFSSWMRILAQVAGSVLLLFADQELARSNLRDEAVKRGVDASRLVFAPRVPAPEYLARFRAADLFLDTLPYNAGTTASDALWAGLPVLTCMGEAFSSRVAASVLHAIELPELITSSPQEYEALAVKLATVPAQLEEIKKKLERNRLTTRLFDTPLFARNLETAYLGMYERQRAGLPPDHMSVAL
jgi:predicted O-linked N-acetylglucosamine transferase (SPINDLY family)